MARRPGNVTINFGSSGTSVNTGSGVSQGYTQGGGPGGSGWFGGGGGGDYSGGGYQGGGDGWTYGTGAPSGGDVYYDAGPTEAIEEYVEPTPVERNDLTEQNTQQQQRERDQQQQAQQQEQERANQQRAQAQQQQPSSQQQSQQQGSQQRTGVTRPGAATTQQQNTDTGIANSLRNEFDARNELNESASEPVQTIAANAMSRAEISAPEQVNNDAISVMGDVPTVVNRTTEMRNQSEQHDANVETSSRYDARANDFAIMSPEPINQTVQATPARSLQSSYKNQKAKKLAEKREKRSIQSKGLGNGLSAELLSNRELDLLTVSYGVHEYQGAMQEGSAFRNLIEQYDNTIDWGLAAQNDAYAYDALKNVFSNNVVTALSIKHPTPGLGDQIVRRLDVHPGDGAWLHPSMLKMSQADADGDLMQVSFLPGETRGVRTPIDALIDQNRHSAIDDSVVPIRTWWAPGDDPVSTVANQLNKYTAVGRYGFSARQVNKLAEAIVKEATGHGGYKEMLQILQTMGEVISGANIMQWGESIQMPRYEEAVSEFLKSIFDYNFFFLDASTVNQDPGNIQETEYAFDADAGLDFDTGSTNYGSRPANFMDNLNAVKAIVGFVKEKNPQFRLTAAFAKMINNASNLVIGRDVWRDKDKGRHLDTANELITMQMSGLAGMRDYQFNAVSVMRKNIIKHVGAPIQYPSITDFCKAFADAFNKFNYIATVSNYQILSGYTAAAEGNNWKYNEISDPSNFDEIAKNFVRVYADMNMGALFGVSNQIAKNFASFNVSEFVNLANLQMYTQSESRSLNEFLRAVATTKFSKIRTYNKNFVDLTNKMIYHPSDEERAYGATNMTLLKRAIESVQDGVDLYYDGVVQSYTDAMYLFGPDWFTKFGMESIDGFQNNPIFNHIGQRFINAKSEEELRSIAYEFQARAKMDEPLTLRRNGKVEKMEVALDKLAETSKTWNLLVSDFRQNGALLEAMLQDSDFINNGKIPGSSALKSSISNNFWNSIKPGEHKTMVEEILFSDQWTGTEKENVLNDFIKYQRTGDKNHQSFEITWDIFAEAYQKQPGINASTDFGINDALDLQSTATSYVDNANKKAYEVIRKQVSDARENLERGDLSSYLNNVANGNVLTHIINMNEYVDAVAASFDLTYASSEKPSQEEAVNNLYKTLSEAINYGQWSDLALADDFALGKIAYDRLTKSPRLIARLLADPDFQIEVYDGKKHKVLDQTTLLKNEDPTEANIWEFLLENPRVAMGLRTHAAYAKSPKAGGGNAMVATDDLTSSILYGKTRTDANIRDLILTKMANHPGFAALAVAGTHAEGRTREQISSDLRRNIRCLIENLWECATKAPNEHLDGWVAENIVNPLVESEGFNEMVLMQHEMNEQDESPHQVEMYLQKLFTRYIYEIKGMNLPAYQGKAPDFTFNFWDQSSMRGFFMVYQTLNSAQTSESTSINGGESQRNQLLSAIAQHVEPACDSDVYSEEITPENFLNEWDKYEDLRIKDMDVIVDGQTYKDIYDAAVAAETNIVLEKPSACTAVGQCVCERHSPADPMRNRRGLNTTALSRYMLIKRADGTERLNLKRKKSGDDDTDRIVKHTIDEILERYHEQDITNYVVNAESDEAAIELLARYMQESDRELDYTDMTIYEYQAIAKFLIHTDPETNQRYIASIEESASVVSNAIANTVRASDHYPNTDEMVAISQLALSEYGSANTQIDLDALLAQTYVLQQNKNAGVSRAAIHHLQSFDRNSNMVIRLIQRYLREHGSDDGLLRTVSAVDKTDAYIRSKFEREARIVPRGFKIVGIAGSQAMRTAIGPNMAVVMANKFDKKKLFEDLKLAHDYGMNVFFTKQQAEAVLEVALPEWSANMVQMENGVVTIPFFDVRLNGGNTTLNDGGFNVGVHKIDFTRLVRLVEDPLNTLALTDAEAQAMQGFLDRTSAYNYGEYKIPVSEQFPNVIAGVGGLSEIQFSIPLKQDIEAKLIKPLTINWDWGAIQMDPGRLINSGEHMSQEEKDAITTYISRWNETDDRGWLTNVDVKPGDVIGFTQAQYNGVVYWHPIRVFDPNISGEKSAPMSMRIDYNVRERQFGSITDPTIELHWLQQEPIEGRTFKTFEEYGFNKFMTRDKAPKDLPYRKLKNGWDVDIVVAEFSTKSRRIGWRMIQLMNTLMSEARVTKTGYNFAEIGGTFPNNPEIKQALTEGTMTLGMWKQALTDNDIRFMPNGYEDAARMDAFLNRMARDAIKFGINPSDVFATRYNDTPTNNWFNFQVLFYGNTQFKNNLMEFFNFMDPTFCPKSVDDFRDDTLFNNELQMLVPYTDARGNEFYRWSNVFTGMHFLDRHYSGFSAPGRRPVANGSRAMDVTTSYGGRWLSNVQAEDYIGHAFVSYPRELTVMPIVREDEAE